MNFDNILETLMTFFSKQLTRQVSRRHLMITNLSMSREKERERQRERPEQL